MALRPMPIRFNDKERELLDKLAELIGEEKGENIEPTTAVRLAIREALEKRGAVLDEEDFKKNKEGRPKDLPATSFNDAGRNNTTAGADTLAVAL